MDKNFKKYTVFILIYVISLLSIYPRYYFLIWNIFLAYIPFFLSYLDNYIKNKYVRLFNVLISLIFYPNAIYVFTDLIHISRVKYYTKINDIVKYNMNILVWIKLALIFIAVLIAMKLSYISIKNYVNKINSIFKYPIYIIISLLSGLAVFIGRFIRLNSWDLALRPIETIFIILKQINEKNIGFILIFIIIQFVILVLED